MAKEDRILLTGATGFLGSHLMAALLRRGKPLSVLARSSRGLSAVQRIGRLLDWFEIDQGERAGLEIIEGRVDQAGFGMGSDFFSGLRGRFGSIIHSASDTSFSERKRAAIERANIQGLQNVLELAAGGCRSFHYISTAYTAGKRAGLCREELVAADFFHNPYEATKYRAERMAGEHCRREGIRLSIHRPSIVYGDSRSGRTFRFNALYYPIKTIHFLKELFETDIRERGGVHARDMGVHAGENGSLHLPIRVEVVEGGGINLVPVDFFVNAFMEIMGTCPEGGIFQIVNPRARRIEDLIDFIRTFFHIEGMRPCRHADPAEGPRNALEILFDSYLEVYAPYMQDQRTFENERTRALLAGKGIECPDFDYEIFSRCMGYAVAVEWGRGLQF